MPTFEEKLRDFQTDMIEVELRNIKLFMSRPALNLEDETDVLKNHYQIEVLGRKVYFGFVQGSDLPINIRKSCVATFTRYFPYDDIIGGFFNR